MSFLVALRICTKCRDVCSSALSGYLNNSLLQHNFTKINCILPKSVNRFFSSSSLQVILLRRGLNNIYCNRIRKISKKAEENTIKFRNRSTLLYFSGFTILALGLSYAAVPLYRIFCQATNYGGQVNVVELGAAKVASMKKLNNRMLKVRFNADLSSTLAWNFKPQQTEILLAPGETALAFYTATNSTDRPVTGIATYNVIPFEAGPYFNKIQCFCFEEQRLNPHEQVDMPVFFYIDPEWVNDPKLENVDTLTLSYTFFEAKEGLKLPIPSYAKL